MAHQEALKAPIEVSDNSKEEKNVSLKINKLAVPVLSLTAKMVILGEGQLAGSGVPSPATSFTLSLPIFEMLIYTTSL